MPMPALMHEYRGPAWWPIRRLRDAAGAPGGRRVVRWGGEEFILLPHTDPAAAPILAERVREAVAATAIVQQDVPSPIVVTLSLGTAGADAFPSDPDSVIAVADAASDVAKHGGRNRVEYGRQFTVETRELPTARIGQPG